MPPFLHMTQFKVIGKDWGKHVVQLPDGSIRHVDDAELASLKEEAKTDKPEAPAQDKTPAKEGPSKAK